MANRPLPKGFTMSNFTTDQIKADEKAAWNAYDKEMEALDAYAKTTDEVEPATPFRFTQLNFDPVVEAEAFARMTPTRFAIEMTDEQWEEFVKKIYSDEPDPTPKLNKLLNRPSPFAN